MSGQPISRRSLLRVTAAGAGALSVGRLASARPAAAATAFYKGADVSWVQQMEALGYSWRNASGATQDIFTILKGYGLSAIRLRTFVNPSSDPVNGHCGISETAAMAVRAKNAGLAVNIDYHFSDTWADEGHQNSPAAWANMSYSQMLSAISSYVTSTMNVIKSSGVTPAWVQIGNEINSGICHPVGSASNPAQMTGLLNAAHDAVKQVFPGAIVMIHLASPQHSTVAAFFSAYSSNGGRWDMNGFSSYGSASAAASLVGDMKSVSDAYGKPYMQVEFGGPVSSPSSTETALQNYLNALQSNGGQGLLYWEPEVYSPFTSYGMGAWDAATREPTIIMNGFTGGSTSGGNPTYVQIRNAATGLSIDGGGATSNGSAAEQWSGTGSTNQQWVIQSDGSYVRFKNRATGLYIDGAGATSNGSAAEQWSDTNSNNQQWAQLADGGNVRFQNRATGLFLDGMGATSNGSDLGQRSSTGSTSQQWTTIAAG
jgi:arabinogalactan endo-1,4-beta-galactosidase